jgi:hypothetical protein
MINNMRISGAVNSTIANSDYSNQLIDGDFYNGGYTNTDGTTGNETSWQTDWAKWHNYYLEIPIFAQIIDTLVIWTIGKGFKGKDKEKLMRIVGMGKDDPNSVFENLLKVALIAGDSHGEIIKDKAQRLTNLKPLNPGGIKTYFNKHGILDRYEQISPITEKVIGKPYLPKKMFHLMWNRLADEIHGKPFAERAEPIIKQIKQIQEDLGIRFHRLVKPIRLFEANTDDTTELKDLEVKLATGYKKCDFIVIPKGSMAPVEGEKQKDANDAIEYLNTLMRQLVTVCGVPEIVLGWSTGTTKASAKIVYLAFQQRIERLQKFLEEQIRIQLNIEINFEFPASLEPALTESNKKSKKINTMSS